MSCRNFSQLLMRGSNLKRRDKHQHIDAEWRLKCKWGVCVLTLAWCEQSGSAAELWPGGEHDVWWPPVCCPDRCTETPACRFPLRSANNNKLNTQTSPEMKCVCVCVCVCVWVCVCVCVCVCVDLLSCCCGRDVLFEAERDGHVPQLLLQSLKRHGEGKTSASVL